MGIDLGTTNSAVSLWLHGKAVLVPNQVGEVLTPSVVGLADDGTILTGARAAQRLQSHPHLTTASFKRYMGSEKPLVLGNQQFRAEELSALLLRQLKEDAEHWTGATLVDAVITVPAYFNDVQRRAVKTAGQLAGLNVVRLLNEPTAASLAFGLLENREQKYLTFDLGGGTFDVSIIDMFEGVVEVRASCGDVMLGGDDFTDAICQWMIEQRPQVKAHLPAVRPQLIAAAEKLKCMLTHQEEAHAQLSWQDNHWNWILNTAMLAKCCQPLLERLQHPVQQALHDARIASHELDHILLVGGSTRMPLIHQTVARLFGRFPRHDLHPDEAVALGAGVQAGMVMADAAVEDIILTDVMPFSLGVEIVKQHYGQIEEGFFLPLIERNTFLPVSMMKTVYTIRDDQQHVLLNIFQGEARRTKDNILLGSMSVNVPPRKAGEIAVNIRFTYTLDGLLEVECRHSESETLSRLVIEKVPGQMSEEQINNSLQRLAELKQHPRDRAENQALLKRGAELYSFLLGDERARVDEWITLFEQALQSQDVRQISQMRQQLEQVLHHFDNRTPQ